MENMEQQDRANRSVVVFNDTQERTQDVIVEVIGDQSMTDRRSVGGSQFALKRKNSEVSMGGSVYKRASMVGPAPPKLSRSVLGGSFFKKDPGLKRQGSC